jgi:hypothetical protein
MRGLSGSTGEKNLQGGLDNAEGCSQQTVPLSGANSLQRVRYEQGKAAVAELKQTPAEIPSERRV